MSAVCQLTNCGVRISCRGLDSLGKPRKALGVHCSFYVSRGCYLRRRIHRWQAWLEQQQRRQHRRRRGRLWTSCWKRVDLEKSFVLEFFFFFLVIDQSWQKYSMLRKIVRVCKIANTCETASIFIFGIHIAPSAYPKHCWTFLGASNRPSRRIVPHVARWFPTETGRHNLTAIARS